MAHTTTRGSKRENGSVERRRTNPEFGEVGSTQSGFQQFAQQLQNEFAHFFDELGRRWGDSKSFGGIRSWGLDLNEQGDTLLVRAEAPGFEPDDFDLQVLDDRLFVRAAKESGASEQDKWSRRDFYRSILLPRGVEVDKVEAQYGNGVLTVKLPMTDASKGRRIAVAADS